MFVTTRNRALTQFSYKVNGFILFCNLLAYTFLKTFFFSPKDVSLSEEISVLWKQ